MKTCAFLATLGLVGGRAGAGGPADAAKQVFSETFSYSESLYVGQRDVSILPCGVLSASLGPSTLYDLTQVMIDWSCSETFTGATGSSTSGVILSFGGTMSVDGDGYNGNGGGNSNGRAPDMSFSASASRTQDDTLELPNSPLHYNPAISTALSGSSPTTFARALNDSATSDGTAQRDPAGDRGGRGAPRGNGPHGNAPGTVDAGADAGGDRRRGRSGPPAIGEPRPGLIASPRRRTGTQAEPARHLSAPRRRP